jgi:SNF2 family DNA or RNA helicase
MATRVLIVDDHPAIREGLAVRIGSLPDLEVCGEAEDVLEAIKLIEADRPDVVVVDIQLETDFKRQYVRRGNPRDPRNRERLRSLLGEVMIRNTRSLVQLDLPPRYAQTLLAQPRGDEAAMYGLLNAYLRSRKAPLDKPGRSGMIYGNGDEEADSDRDSGAEDHPGEAEQGPAPAPGGALPPLGRRQLSALLLAAGSHAAALLHSLENIVGHDPQARPLVDRARRIGRTAKDEQFLGLLRQGRGEKMLVFASFRRTLEHLRRLLKEEGVPFTVYSGDEDVFVFNLCTAGSLEARILALLDEALFGEEYE